MENDHFIEIYSNQAEAYQRMTAAEDVDHNLLPALNRLVDFFGQRVLDLGSGTGRLARLLHEQASSGVVVDLHWAMLLENRRQQHSTGFFWPLVQGDLHRLPLASASAGVVAAGWAIGHFCAWYGEQWQSHVERALREMERVAQPGGDLIILETLGTGALSPAPPTPQLATYYELLEQRWSFQRTEVTTDYQFDSVSDAVAYMEFFFGEHLAQEIRRRGWQRVPEWTGIWRKQV